MEPSSSPLSSPPPVGSHSSGADSPSYFTLNQPIGTIYAKFDHLPTLDVPLPIKINAPVPREPECSCAAFEYHKGIIERGTGHAPILSILNPTSELHREHSKLVSEGSKNAIQPWDLVSIWCVSFVSIEPMYLIQLDSLQRGCHHIR